MVTKIYLIGLTITETPEFSKLILKVIFPIFVTILLSILITTSIAYKEPTEEDLYAAVQTIINHQFEFDGNLKYSLAVYFAHIQRLTEHLGRNPEYLKKLPLIISGSVETSSRL